MCFFSQPEIPRPQPASPPPAAPEQTALRAGDNPYVTARNRQRRLNPNGPLLVSPLGGVTTSPAAPAVGGLTS